MTHLSTGLENANRSPTEGPVKLVFTARYIAVWQLTCVSDLTVRAIVCTSSEASRCPGFEGGVEPTTIRPLTIANIDSQPR